MKSEDFQTADIDLAAAIMAVTEKQPRITRQSGRQLVSFDFTADESIQAVVMGFASGSLAVNARRFATARALLYRIAREYRNGDRR